MVCEHFLLIDSRLRDTSKYITPAQYSFELSLPLQNVKSIELVHAIYGKNDSNPEKYAYLCVKEVSTKCFISTSRSYPLDDNNVFTYLPFHKQLQDTLEYEFTSQTFKAIHTFEEPLTNLSSLSIAIIDKDGRLFPIQEHMLCFVLTTADFITQVAETQSKTKPKSTLTPKTPYDVLGLVQGTFSLEILVERFKEQANILRSSGNFSYTEYDELKLAFKKLANTFKKDTT
jgi:hypothetical protein